MERKCLFSTSYCTEVWSHGYNKSPLIQVIELVLTHWGQDKMAAIFQKTFSNAFSWMKMYKFLLKFHWSVFPGVQLAIFHHWFRQWLGANQVTIHYLNQWWLVYWCIYASLCLNELTKFFDMIWHHQATVSQIAQNRNTVTMYPLKIKSPSIHFAVEFHFVNIWISSTLRTNF